MLSIIFLMLVLLVCILVLGIIAVLARKNFNSETDSSYIGNFRRSYDAWERSRRMNTTKYL